MFETRQLNEAVSQDDKNVVDKDAQQQLFAVIYEELRKIARQFMQHEHKSRTLQPTALVNEVWLKLFHGRRDIKFESRGHFFVVVSNAMRQILVDAARARKARKRGGEFHRAELPIEGVQRPDDQELLDLDVALEALESVSPEKAHLVKMRYFSGLTLDECARIMDISPSTASRHWKFAKAWLKRYMTTT